MILLEQALLVGAGVVLYKWSKNSKSSCCIGCHFEFEESKILPYLDLATQQRLLNEHQMLRERGYPRSEVLSHSIREMEWFRNAKVPLHLIAKAEKDHIALNNYD